jgi:hypothetical protein
MSINLAMLGQLISLLMIPVWIGGSAYICYRLGMTTSLGKKKSAQIGAVLSLVPPVLIIYVALLLYLRRDPAEIA